MPVPVRDPEPCVPVYIGSAQDSYTREHTFTEERKGNKGAEISEKLRALFSQLNSVSFLSSRSSVQNFSAADRETGPWSPPT